MTGKADFLSTMRHLYEGESSPFGIEVAHDITFRDPLVVVHGRPQVISMFRRLNRLFPYSKIQRFDQIDASANDYDLLVHYRRKPTAAPRPFHTRLQLQVSDDRLVSIVEHWQSPLSFSANAGSRLTELARRGLGRLLSSSRPGR